MKNKRLCLPGAGDQQHEEKDGEEGNDGTGGSIVALSSSERCPICLNGLSLEIGIPEGCCHTFCISCILKWSETSTSCPVDRKPYQTVYKIDSVGGFTKVHVMARTQRENCNCNLCHWCCSKGKICLRMDFDTNPASEFTNVCPKDGCKDEMTELEMRNVSCESIHMTGDFMLASLPDPGEIYHINSEEEEESDLCLIQRKREGLKHLRLPTTMESNSSLSVETLIHSPSFLDDYIFAIRPLTFRNKGFSKRTCVHSCAQEGTEKKQAASGSKGTRRKSVQSNTRRRSTRNSKSDVSQLPNSPKSSNSDNDASGCNSASTNEHSNKPPAKQRKRAPKKAPRSRKRLRSATQTRQEVDENKGDSESESEQEEKKLKIPDDSSDTAIFETALSPASSTEKVSQPVDDHSPLSPVDRSTEEHIPASSPMQNLESSERETSESPDLQNEQLFDKENSSPSPVFTNGQPSLEKSQQESMSASELDEEVDSKQHLDSKVGNSLQAENLHESEEECPGSPLSIKCTDADSHKESGSSDSESEVNQESTIPPASSKDIPKCTEQEYSDVRQTGEQSSEIDSNRLSPSKAKHLPDLEDQKEPSKGEEATNLPAVDPEIQSCFKHSSSEENQSAADVQVVHAESPVQDSSLSNDVLEDKPINGMENRLQVSELTDIKINAPGEVEHMGSTDVSVNSAQLQSTVETDDVQHRLCNDEPHIVPLVCNRAEGIPEVSSLVTCSEMPDHADLEKESKGNREKQVTYSEDNNDSVAMECDSVSSDRESEQPNKFSETCLTEPGSSASTKTEESNSTEKQSVPLEGTPKKESRPRRSRFHSPSTTWSPSKMEVKERQKSRSRSRSKNRDSPGKRKSRSRSRERDRNHSEQWKGRNRDRRHRRQSRSKSRSRSRSGSRTRNRSYTGEKNEKDSSPWRGRRSNDNWKSPRGGDRYRRNEHEKPNENVRSDKYDTKDSTEPYPEDKSDQLDWVSERIKSFEDRGRGDGWVRGDRGRGWGDSRGRGRGENRGRGDFRGRGDNRGRGDGRGGSRGRGSPRDTQWEENQYNSSDSRNRNANMDWNSPRARGGRGRGNFRGGFNYGDQNENWNDRQPYSGNSNTSGQESVRGQEHKNYNLKYEETFESPVDRSGWTSASSWAVRKTLPADVQSYYSKRGRNSSASQQGWTRPEASQDQDQAVKDQPSQQTESAQMPVNMVQTPMNVVAQPITAPPPQPVNIYPYSVGVHPPLVSMQHNPYNIHPPLPIHLHPALPLVQVSAPSSVPQGLPPPPPPPPPSHQIGYVMPQQDGKPLQKIHIQERAAQEVKHAIKQYYQNKDITKDEYKEIVKKAVDKVCHSKSGEVDSAKVANLVKAYVDKYKHSRKKGSEDKL